MKTNSSLIEVAGIRFARYVQVIVGVLWLALPTVGQALTQDYQVLYRFPGTGSGSYGARGALMCGADGFLYGTTFASSNLAGGQVFKIKVDGTGFTALKEFPDHITEGGWPRWLVISGNTLYGTAASGGASDNGMLFRMNTDGSDYTVLQHFYGTNGPGPLGLVLDGLTLYGTTLNATNSNNGALYKINTDGSGFSIIKSFNGDDGDGPANLVMSSNTLYGITFRGGGTIFRIQTDGASHTILRRLNVSTDGGSPLGCLLLSGTTLYGTAGFGGSQNGGTLFRIETDGTGFAVLKNFSVGDSPRSGLVMSGSALYGSTTYGPNGEEGTIFRINTDRSDFTVLKHLDGTDGGSPWAAMCLVGDRLYGTTEWGGINNHGVVFTLSIAPPQILNPPDSQTAETGNQVYFPVKADGLSPLSYRWFFGGVAITNPADSNPTLKLTNVNADYSGLYTVVVTNHFGGVTSPPAMLSVIAPVERRPAPAISVIGEPGSSLRIDYTEALFTPITWRSLSTVSLATTSQVCFDIASPLPPQRFYRAWQTGTPAVLPSLDLNFVPAITLTGDIGSDVRVEGINAIGPTDAWFTLGTVTLTNTSQLYFDVSVIGQPPRLYRLVPVP